MTETTRSALIFGARNLGRAIIETLVAQGWNVAGAARSDETLANITAAGALALRSDITDQAAVRATVEEAAQALGAIDLIVNAAAAYGGTRTGAFGGGPIADAAPDAFDSWSVAPARSAFAFLSGTGGALADPRQVPDAVVYLAEQGPRAATHELQVTPLAETWVP